MEISNAGCAAIVRNGLDRFFRVKIEYTTR